MISRENITSEKYKEFDDRISNQDKWGYCVYCDKALIPDDYKNDVSSKGSEIHYMGVYWKGYEIGHSCKNCKSHKSKID